MIMIDIKKLGSTVKPLTVSNGLFADTTETIPLDLWQYNIAKVQPGAEHMHSFHLGLCLDIWQKETFAYTPFSYHKNEPQVIGWYEQDTSVNATNTILQFERNDFPCQVSLRGLSCFPKNSDRKFQKCTTHWPGHAYIVVDPPLN